MSEKQPKIITRAPTIEEEFKQLELTLKRKDFYDKSGYTVVYPEIKELSDPSAIKNPDSFLLFKNREYKEGFYTKGLNTIQEHLPPIEKKLGKLASLEKNWGFKLFPTYLVVLTKYGPGGSYDSINGRITMLTTVEGSFKRPDPEHTILHEIVHIGIEDAIVKEYNLDHSEKERLVDLFIKKYYETELPDYKCQSIGNANLDKYILDIKSLPEEIQDYVKNKN